MAQSFPVIASTLDPLALVGEILPQFGLDGIVECRFFTGGFNHTYRILMNDGRTYYLRAYRIILPIGGAAFWMKSILTTTWKGCARRKRI